MVSGKLAANLHVKLVSSIATTRCDWGPFLRRTGEREGGREGGRKGGREGGGGREGERESE